jgi:HNH endonuclease
LRTGRGSPETARRLACDCSYVALFERGGRPLSFGRRTRSIPPAIRRALAARDGRCRFRGCERKRFVDAHHIHHWARGGETALDNLVLLCRHHHRLVHEGGFSVSLDAEGRPRFSEPDDVPVCVARALRPDASPLAAAAGPLLTGTGEKMDLASCVDAVLVATGLSDASPGLSAARPGLSAVRP